MHDVVALCDLVDGMDLDVQWGREHLDLSDTNDLTWAERSNELIRESMPPSEVSFLYEFSVVAESREKIWEQAVNGKEERMRGKYQTEYWKTRFRLHTDSDPTLQDRDYV